MITLFIGLVIILICRCPDNSKCVQECRCPDNFICKYYKKPPKGPIIQVNTLTKEKFYIEKHNKNPDDCIFQYPNTYECDGTPPFCKLKYMIENNEFYNIERIMYKLIEKYPCETYYLLLERDNDRKTLSDLMVIKSQYECSKNDEIGIIVSNFCTKEDEINIPEKFLLLGWKFWGYEMGLEPYIESDIECVKLYYDWKLS